MSNTAQAPAKRDVSHRCREKLILTEAFLVTRRLAKYHPHCMAPALSVLPGANVGNLEQDIAQDSDIVSKNIKRIF